MEESKESRRFKIHEHPVIVTLSACAAVFGLAWYFLATNYTAQVDVYKARIEDLTARLSERKDYETLFHEEATKRHESELNLANVRARLQITSTELDELKDKKWQEQYAVTKVEMQSCREELGLLKARHTDMLRRNGEERQELLTKIERLESGPHPTTLPAYDALMNDTMKLRREHVELRKVNGECEDENRRLKDQLGVMNNQINSLRNMSAPLATQNSETDRLKQRLLGIVNSVQGMDDVYRVEPILKGLMSINARIDASYLLAMIKGMRVDAYKKDVIVGAAPYLIYPIDPQTMQQLTGTIGWGSYKSDVIKALNEAAQKSSP